MTYQAISQNKGRLPVKALCGLLGVSRGAFYHHLKVSPKRSEENRELIRRMEKIARSFSGYGYRRMAEELRRQGFRVNHKRVLKLMRRAGLLVRGRRRFVKTTDSNHPHRIYPNLAKGFMPNGINQLWVADITYIALASEFCYLAALIDVFSRRAVGYNLSRSLDHRLALDALKMAISSRDFTPGLIHHSDQGIQYACEAYTKLLDEKGIRISMSAKGNPYDNAFAESFMATLKKEEVNISEYETFDEARKSICDFIDKVYNRKRLHSSLGYVTPAEFEKVLKVAVGT